MVAYKRGELGAGIRSGEASHELEVTAVSGGDSIGAGDSFDAGFLAGWLRGLPPPRCLEIACCCGSRVAGAIGGLNCQPRWEEISPTSCRQVRSPGITGPANGARCRPIFFYAERH